MNPSPHILVIDDERDVTVLLSKELKAAGYRVTSFPTGKGALDRIRETLPDLILLDIWLPGMSGKDIFLELHHSVHTNKIPVIFFSADPSQEDYCLKELKAHGFVRKPYETQHLLSLVRDVLNCRENNS